VDGDKYYEITKFENSLKSIETLSDYLDKELQSAVKVDGQKNISVRFAKCCSPTPGDEIVAYSTIRGNITVHRKDCKTLLSQNIDPARIHKAKWESKFVALASVVIDAKLNNKLFQEIYNYLTLNKIMVKSIQIMNVRDVLFRIEIVFPIIAPYHSKIIEQFIRSVRLMPGVIRVRRKTVQT